MACCLKYNLIMSLTGVEFFPYAIFSHLFMADNKVDGNIIYRLMI